MTGITSSLSNLLGSILDIFRSILNTLLSSLQGVGAVCVTSLSSIFDLAKGLFEFLLGNIVIIAVLVVAFVGYTAFQQRQGRGVAGGKKNA
ncbi:hypothetical protein MMC08_003265 [Hypocenomyce scalaris]|nr:hypothetical protein [Hypocenomyce scalaris]